MEQDQTKMPAFERAVSSGLEAASQEWEYLMTRATSDASTPVELSKRIFIPVNSSSSPEQIIASLRDPWIKAGRYSLGWVYFCIILIVITTALRVYHLWNDKIRTALFKESIESNQSNSSSPSLDYEMANLDTNNTAAKLFPRHEEKPQQVKEQSSLSSIGPVNNAIALMRWVFYRPIPDLKWRKRSIVFPSLAVVGIVACATIFVTIYSFAPQPLYYATIVFGSPPLAIRAGMIAVAMMPWIVAMSMKANLVSMLTGIGHERLNVLHRWGGYLCLFLSLVHTVPFYVQPVWDGRGMEVFQAYFQGQVVYGTGIAALVPLLFLCIASLPFIRAWMYELFVALHVPVAMIYVGMLFWHCHNYLTSWHYLYATVAIWLLSWLMRLGNLNWTNPWRLSWLVGDEASVTLLSEDAVKVTIPTQVRWKPGQYVYLRMPGISIFENHPFTIASLCSEDFPSEYGEDYRDMMLVFKPFGGFTRKVLNTALEKGPFKTYRAFIDGPYGGMQRDLAAFDSVVLIAGGSGITAVVSQLLQLVKQMRDGKAVTKTVQVIWAIKRLESVEWFREELRICRECSPPDSVHCQFFVTAAKRHQPGASISSKPHSGIFSSEKFNDFTHGRPVSGIFGSEKLEGFAQGIASKRNSALIRDEAGGDIEKERELRAENEDGISALPPAHRPAQTQKFLPPPPPFPPSLQQQQQQQHPARSSSRQHTPRSSAPHTPPETEPLPFFPPPPPSATLKGAAKKKAAHARQKPSLGLEIPNPPIFPTSSSLPAEPAPAATGAGGAGPGGSNNNNFEFGFPSTPTVFQKNLMRFAFGPGVVKKKEGWSTEYGRPDIPYMLKELSADFGKRTCVFVCGPPAMRHDVANTVARLQTLVMGDTVREEISMYSENYAV
ncbi:MAG: hypothetical protein M1825_002554 [Sarcosagium campestre]|nr:MAG: hypothetical protein M1825_002554 [Sarcosagium campestre]